MKQIRTALAIASLLNRTLVRTLESDRSFYLSFAIVSSQQVCVSNRLKPHLVNVHLVSLVNSRLCLNYGAG